MHYLEGVLVLCCAMFLLLALGCQSDRSPQLQHLVGKSESEVVKELGEPHGRAAIKHPGLLGLSEAEVDRYLEDTEDRFLIYPGVTVVLNCKSKVLRVRPPDALEQECLQK